MAAQIAVRNPFTGQIDLTFDEPDQNWLAAECARLKSGQRGWQALPVTERVAALEAFAAALTAAKPAIVAALKVDTGRSRIAELEFVLLLQAIERVCAAAPRVMEDVTDFATGDPHISAQQQKVPYGLLLNIAPWNFPLLLSLIDVFPALAVGNAAIVKPSEVTPRWVEPVIAALGNVPAVENVLGFALGSGATGATLIKESAAVSFTGSVATGRKVAEAAAASFIPAFLELGGNDPAIVLRSANIEQAAERIVFSSTSSSGQACQSLERVYVDAAIADELTLAIIARAREVTINYPDLEEGFIGPFIFAKQPGKVMAQLDDAVARGARIETGGKLIDHGGIWLEATVVTGVDHTMALMTEETFGPVIPIMPFSDVDEAVRLANDTHYGLSASVFAGKVEEGAEVARSINAGAISVNDASLTSRVHTVPHESFGLSGLGRSRFGDEALLRYLRTKAILKQTG